MAWPPRPTEPGRRPGFPPSSWPSKHQLEYVRLLVVVVLLLLAVPWLVGKLVTRPGEVLEGAGKRAVHKGP